MRTLKRRRYCYQAIINLTLYPRHKQSSKCVKSWPTSVLAEKVLVRFSHRRTEFRTSEHVISSRAIHPKNCSLSFAIVQRANSLFCYIDSNYPPVNTMPQKLGKNVLSKRRFPPLEIFSNWISIQKMTKYDQKFAKLQFLLIYIFY